jgi:hypothetical protein
MTESCLLLIGDKKTRTRSVYLALYWNRPQGRIIQAHSQLSVLTTAVVYGGSQHEQAAGSGLSAGSVQRWTRSDPSFGVDTVTLLVTIRTVLARDRIKAINLTRRVVGSAGEDKLQKCAPSSFCVYCRARREFHAATLPEDRSSVGRYLA